jgi:NTP pyrophosphatase (non-canonical NTP hydrolase)
MVLQEAQKKVDQWIREYGVRYFNELTNMAILTEEVGEVARIIARDYGEQSQGSATLGKAALADELADVMFVLLCIANQTGIDLEKAFEKNLAKKSTRDFDRHQQNDKLR